MSSALEVLHLRNAKKSKRRSPAIFFRAMSVSASFAAESVVSAARDYVCEVCKVRIRPQVFQEIKKNDQIIACDACQRILYDPENLDHPFETV